MGFLSGAGVGVLGGLLLDAVLRVVLAQALALLLLLAVKVRRD